jgi:hypothetical protein
VSFFIEATRRGVSQGLKLIQGQMHAKLENQNGVVIYLAGETEGLASFLECSHSWSR